MNGWVNAELPFSGSTPLSAHCSYEGARQAQAGAGTQTMRLLEFYAKRGPATDMEAARALGWPRSTVNARRGSLCQRGIVVAKGTKTGEAGVKNTLWGLV